MVVAGVDPGPETAHPLPPLPAGTVSPGRPLRDFRRSVSWEIRAPGARQGEVVRLEVPVKAYLRAGALERLRLETGGRQIPFVQWVPPEPARELAGTSLRPLAARPGFPGQPPHSRLGISIPETPFELTSFEVTSWSALNVSGGSWNPPGGQGSWDCRPAVALPCRLEAGPRDPRSGGTEIELDVGDSAARPGVTLWRPRQALGFVWPASGPVRLLAGDETVAAPRYDLAALADQLLIRPWKPALAGPAEDLSAGDVVPPGLRLGGLALAAVALLGLIYKMLPPA